MLIKEIESAKNKIYRSIEEKRIFDVFNQIEELLSLGSSPNLVPKLKNLRTTYEYMTQYMLQGVLDPQRDKLYSDLIKSLYEITDIMIDDFMINEASDYLYDKRRYYRLKGETSLFKNVELLKQEQEKYQLLKEAKVEDTQLITSLKNIENIQEEIFGIVASSFTLTNEDYQLINRLLNEDEFGYITTSLVISALTLSTLNFYSEKKIITLLDRYTLSSNEEVKQRALCGALILMYMHRNQVNMSDNIEKRVNLFSEDYRFCQDVRHQFLQFIRSMETEKISDIFTKEIIPEIIKLTPEIKNKILLEDISDENIVEMFDKNPEWEKKLEDSGITKRIKELNEMQVEGSDVLLSTFSSLKSYPFFNKISNWLRPYTNENSEIYSNIKKEGKYGEMFEKSMFMCNSDRYSFALTLSQISHQRNMFNNIPDDIDINEMFRDNVDIKGGVAKNISTLYIQDLYRLFKLSKFKLTNIFDYHINLFEVDVLKPIFDEEETLRLIGEFYLKKEYFLFAQPYFKTLITRNVTDAVLYQKLGYCKQMLKDYEGAIVEYKKADNISEDFWTIHHLALCHRAIGKISKAIEYYKEALAMRPNSMTLELQIGHCYLANEKYEDALKHYYKVDFITEGSLKTWRPIAWCSLMLGKLEQAQTYYDKILSNKPKSNDYLNIGHMYLVKNNIKEAYKYYKKSIELNNMNISCFYKTFTEYYHTLIKLGVSENNALILRDIIIQEFAKSTQ